MSNPAPGGREPIRGLAELDELDRLFSALAHRTRRAILVRVELQGRERVDRLTTSGVRRRSGTWSARFPDDD